MKKLLLPTILSIVLLAGCASEGYVSTSVTYYEPYPYYAPLFIGPPIVIYGHPHYYHYGPPPRVIHPIPHNRPVLPRENPPGHR
jgi:hypothetical protein